MKILSRIVLFLFISFQFAPSVLSLIDKEKGSKISLLLLDEDEEEDTSKETKEVKEIKTEFVSFTNQIEFITTQLTTPKTFDFYLINKYSSFVSQILFPPELV